MSTFEKILLVAATICFVVGFHLQLVRINAELKTTNLWLATISAKLPTPTPTEADVVCGVGK